MLAVSYNSQLTLLTCNNDDLLCHVECTTGYGFASQT